MKRCGCPICATSEAHRRIRDGLALAEKAAEAHVVHGAEHEADLYFLIDEIRMAAQEKPKKARKRIREALRIIDAAPQLDWMNAVPEIRGFGC